MKNLTGTPLADKWINLQQARMFAEQARQEFVMNGTRAQPMLDRAEKEYFYAFVSLVRAIQSEDV